MPGLQNLHQGFDSNADQLYLDAAEILNTDCIRLESQNMNPINGSDNHFIIVLNHLLLYLKGFKKGGLEVPDPPKDEYTLANTNTISLFVLSDMRFRNLSSEGMSLHEEFYISMKSRWHVRLHNSRVIGRPIFRFSVLNDSNCCTLDCLCLTFAISIAVITYSLYLIASK